MEFVHIVLRFFLVMTMSLLFAVKQTWFILEPQASADTFFSHWPWEHVWYDLCFSRCSLSGERLLIPLEKWPCFPHPYINTPDGVNPSLKTTMFPIFSCHSDEEVTFSPVSVFGLLWEMKWSTDLRPVISNQYCWIFLWRFVDEMFETCWIVLNCLDYCETVQKPQTVDKGLCLD